MQRLSLPQSVTLLVCSRGSRDDVFGELCRWRTVYHRVGVLYTDTVRAKMALNDRQTPFQS
jgi:hypothetical protein